jgi:hypothetical protein
MAGPETGVGEVAAALLEAASAYPGADALALVVKELMESAHRYVVVGGDCRRIQLRVAEVVLDEGVDPLHQRLRPDFGRKLVLGVQVLGQAGRREVDGDRAETT